MAMKSQAVLVQADGFEKFVIMSDEFGHAFNMSLGAYTPMREG